MIYSTCDVHPRERMSYWLEVATRGFVEHEFSTAAGTAFQGTVHVTTLPGLGLASFDVDPARVIRSERNAARADSGDLLLAMQFAGETGISQDGRDCLVKNRGMYLLDPVRAFDIDLKAHATNMIVKVPRAVLEARVGNVSDLTARAIVPEAGVTALAMDFLELLPSQAEALDTVAGLKIAEQMLDLTALALTSCRREQGATLSSPRATALLRLKATVERLLIEPGLKPERVAAAAGISVRYANALLAQEQSSIERYVNERRLDRCRTALEDVAQAHRAIGEIAFNWGFSDLSHFGRRFKARYGKTPTEYRCEAMLSPAAERV